MFEAHRQYPTNNIFVGGLSLGGAMAYKLAIRNPHLKGAVMLSPAIANNPISEPFQKKFLIALSYILPAFRTWKKDSNYKHPRMKNYI